MLTFAFTEHPCIGQSGAVQLGSVIYFMLAGRPPFRAERTLTTLSRMCNEPHRPVREVNPDVPSAIADLVDRLPNKSTVERIADADTVRTHCLHLLAALNAPDGELNKVKPGDGPTASVDSAHPVWLLPSITIVYLWAGLCK